MADTQIIQLALGIVGVVEVVLGAMFTFLWNGVTKVRDDMSKNIDHVNTTIEARAAEHRQAQQQIWSEVRLFEQRSADHRVRIQEKVSQLPTRDELKAMEDRIHGMFHAPDHRKT